MSIEVRPAKTAAESALEGHFAAARRSLPGAPAITSLRESAFRRFAADGLPHRRIEDWKYTDLRALMREAKPLAPLPDKETKLRARQTSAMHAAIDARRIVFVDGCYVPELSDAADLEPGLTIRSMASALASGDVGQLGRTVQTDDIAVALNTAFMGDGVMIDVAPGIALTRPIHLIFANAGEHGGAVFLRSLITVGKGARAMLVESHEGSDQFQVNTALEMKADANAHVDHVKITRAGALHVSTLMACIDTQARFNEFLFTTGGAVVRNQLFVRFAGEATVAGIRGACLTRESQHVDTTLFAEHAASGCTSREIFKSVLDGESRSIFQGRIIVRPHAQKTDAKMATHALLLSDSAEAVNKPELEIFADDVQCGHGATSGALNEELLFYLKSRGIPQKEAEALLIQAFVGEAVEGIEHAGLRDILMSDVAGWLAARTPQA